MKKLLVLTGLQLSEENGIKNFLSSIINLQKKGYSIAIATKLNSSKSTTSAQFLSVKNVVEFLRLLEGGQLEHITISQEEEDELEKFCAAQLFDKKNFNSKQVSNVATKEEFASPSLKKTNTAQLWKTLMAMQKKVLEIFLKLPFLPNLIAKCTSLQNFLEEVLLIHFSSGNGKVTIMPLNKQTCNNFALSQIVYNSFASCANALLTSPRIAKLSRNTYETKTHVYLNLDGNGQAQVNTGLHFFDHMLTNFAKHAGVNLVLNVKGDLEVDEHHTIEDSAIALGNAFEIALGSKLGLERYGFSLPMDEASASCLLDFSGRTYLQYNIETTRERVGDFPTEMLEHFYDSFAKAAKINLHISSKGKNDHHVIEASFKAMARAFKMALLTKGYDTPSTKGVL